MSTRIYIVTGAGKQRLVEAGTQSQAVRHVVKGQYKAVAATPKDIANLMKTGVQVETASDEAEAQQAEV